MSGDSLPSSSGNVVVQVRGPRTAPRRYSATTTSARSRCVRTMVNDGLGDPGPGVRRARRSVVLNWRHSRRQGSLTASGHPRRRPAPPDTLYRLRATAAEESVAFSISNELIGSAGGRAGTGAVTFTGARCQGDLVPGCQPRSAGVRCRLGLHRRSNERLGDHRATSHHAHPGPGPHPRSGEAVTLTATA